MTDKDIKKIQERVETLQNYFEQQQEALYSLQSEFDAIMEFSKLKIYEVKHYFPNSVTLTECWIGDAVNAGHARFLAEKAYKIEHETHAAPRLVSLREFK